MDLSWSASCSGSTNCPSLKSLDFGDQISFSGDHFKKEAKRQFLKP